MFHPGGVLRRLLGPGRMPGQLPVRACHPAPRAGLSNRSESVVGRWSLVSLVRNGVDETSRSVTNAGGVVYYVFKADGTFRIELGDSVRETGTWSVDTTVSPRLFDHIPDADGRPGPYVPGIYSIAGDTLTICIRAPSCLYWSAAT